MYIAVFYIALFIGLVPLLLLFVKKRFFDWRYPVVPFIWLTGIATAYELVGTSLLKINTAYWFQLYPLLAFLTLHYFFSCLLKPHYIKVFRISLILFILIYCISFFYWDDYNKLISSAINRSYITLFILIFTLIYFKSLFEKLDSSNMYEKVDIPNLWQSDNFYFISGIFIYYSTTFFLFLSSSFIFSSNLYSSDYWLVNVLATLILRTFLILGVWKMKRG